MNMNNLWGFLPFTWEHLVVFSPQILNRTTFLWFCSLKPFFGSKSSGFYWAPSGLDTAGILSGLTAMLLWKILLLKLGGMVLSSTHSGMVPLSTFSTSSMLSFWESSSILPSRYSVSLHPPLALHCCLTTGSLSYWVARSYQWEIIQKYSTPSPNDDDPLVLRFFWTDYCGGFERRCKPEKLIDWWKSVEKITTIWD